MRYQDQVIHSTELAIEAIFKTARAMPADKVEWKPLDAGRSALDQLQECAQAPTWFTGMLENRAAPPMAGGDVMEFVRMAREERSQWTTIDECERICRENSEKLFTVIRDFPDSDLEITIHLPFAGGIDRSMADLMLAHYWNMVYHIGQISYIQTLYGDMEMH